MINNKFLFIAGLVLFVLAAVAFALKHHIVAMLFVYYIGTIVGTLNGRGDQ